MLTIKYWAFGSNLLRQRLAFRVDHLAPVNYGTPFTLLNYKLAFNCCASRFVKNTFANIIYDQGASVEGVLYDLTERQLRCLDMYEALYERKYFRINDTTIGCTYVALPDCVTMLKKKPALDYLNIILDGCKEAGLVRTYNELLEYKKQNYKLKKNRHATD